MTNNKSPSIVRIIQNDYYAFLAIVFPAFFWIFYLYERFIKPDPETTFLTPVLVATMLGTAVFGWRFWAVASLYNSGLETPAIVHEIGFYRDRGRISSLGIQYTPSTEWVGWDQFIKVHKTPALVVLLTAARTFVALPHTFFVSDQEWKLLNQLVDSRVQEAV